MQKSLDLIGQKIGKLTILSKGNNRCNKTTFNCICDCGTKRNIIGSSLVKKNSPTISCGCLKKTHFIDLTGITYNNLTIIKLIGKNKGNCWLYLCKCSCGKETIQEGNDVKSERVKSCGCLRFNKSVINANNNPLKSLLNNLYSDYKKKSEYRNIDFNLNIKDFEILVLDKCSYCGIKSSNIKQHSKKRKIAINSTLLYNGIDRVNNELGYINGNVVTACRICNQAKHQMTKTSFLDWIVRVYNNQKLKDIYETK